MADHSELLVVLAPEHGDIRLHLVEQPRDHGGHAIEMAGAMGALQRVGHARHAHLDRAVGAIRIHGFDRGQPQHVATGLLQATGIGSGRARISAEILVRPELGRIHEHAGDHPVGMLARQPHQRMMPRMQVAHGGHEADAQAVALPPADAFAQRGSSTIVSIMRFGQVVWSSSNQA
jgi:hypothetical protein